MNLSLILAVFASILGHVLAMDNKNPECTDLENLRKNLEKAMNAVPNTEVHCKSNSNCTGLQCNGKVEGKRFNGTVIVEGCHEPVRMLIHANGRRMYVTDGYKRTVIKTPVRVKVQVEMKKKNNIVYVTLSVLAPCLSDAFCPKFSILKDQKIRVHCNGSEKKNQSNKHRNTPSSGWPDDVYHHYHLHQATNKPGNVSRSKIPHQSDGKSLSVGAIVGVVIAVVVFFVILIAIIVWIVHGKRRRVQRYNDVTMNDDSDPLFFNSDPLV